MIIGNQAPEFYIKKLKFAGKKGMASACTPNIRSASESDWVIHDYVNHIRHWNETLE